MTEALVMAANETLREMGFPFNFCPLIFACNEKPLDALPISRAKQQAGLPTQLAVCGSVGAICFLLFCVLRTRWIGMYSPRLRMKKHAPEKLPDSLFGWIWPLLRTPHSVVLEKVGLDAVVLLQFLLMGAKLFGLCGFFGTVVLLPVSLMGGDITNSTDPVDPEQPSDDEYTSVLESPSYLWVYLFFTYFFCFATFYFTFLNYRDYIRLRREFLIRVAKKLPARTVLVTGIPPELRSDRKLAEYFENLGLGVVESVHVIRHVSRLLDYIKERAFYLRQLERAYTNYWGNPCFDSSYDPDRLLNEAEQDTTELRKIDWVPHIPTSTSLPLHTNKKRPRPRIRDGFMGLIGPSQDAIDYYTDRFNLVDELVTKARRLGKFHPTSVGFVTFEHCVSACIASEVLISSTPFQIRVEHAPEPRDILWENITMHNRERMIRKAMMSIILVILVFFWVIPITYLAALTTKDSLKAYFPWLIDLASKNKILEQFIQSFLPTLAVVSFMAILPIIFNYLSVIEGFQTRSEAEESTFSKHFFFLLFNVLLAFTVTSTLFKTPRSMIEDPKKIISLLATQLPQVSPFFVNYTVLQGVMLLPLQLLQIGPIIMQTFWRVCFCATPRDYAEVLAPRVFNYGWGYPLPVFMFVVLLVYSTSAPLILVFGTIYYMFAYLVFKYQLLYVYFRPYEVAGRMWPLIFSRIIVGLLLFEILSCGLFVKKHAYALATLCSLLIGFTILFKMLMDAAYLRSTRHLPLQLVAQRLGAPPILTMPVERPEPQPSVSERSTRHHSTLGPGLRRRRTVLDQDDYVAEQTYYTDFKQPPMTIVDGTLNTGMKRYGHPALVSALPQLWLPVKPTTAEERKQSVSNGQPTLTVDTSPPAQGIAIAKPDEQQPLLVSSPRLIHPYQSIPSEHSIPIHADFPEDGGAMESSSSSSSSSSEEEGKPGNVYRHHPDRRHSRVSHSLTRSSYGAV